MRRKSWIVSALPNSVVTDRASARLAGQDAVRRPPAHHAATVAVRSMGPAPVGRLSRAGSHRCDWPSRVLLAFFSRQRRRWRGLAALVLLLLAFPVVFFWLVAPANAGFRAVTLPSIPPDWTALRSSWETGHAIRFALQFAALALLVGSPTFTSDAGFSRHRRRTRRRTTGRVHLKAPSPLSLPLVSSGCEISFTPSRPRTGSTACQPRPRRYWPGGYATSASASGHSAGK